MRAEEPSINQSLEFQDNISTEHVKKKDVINDTELNKQTINKITFDSDTESIVSSMLIESGKEINQLPIPEKEGYQFLGWYMHDGDKVKLPFIVEGNMNLIAKWELSLVPVDEEGIDGPISYVPGGEIQYNIYPATSFRPRIRARSISVRSSNNPVIGVDHPKKPGEVMLFKEAKPVPGKVNTFNIKVRIERKNKPKTSDVILVMDRSGSMDRPNTKMIEAKKAGKKFVQELLNTKVMRVAVVSYASDVTVDQPLTTDGQLLDSAIDSLEARGGTFTQAAIRQASALLANSTADSKRIIILSDGEPTFSYPMYNPDIYATDRVNLGLATAERLNSVYRVDGFETSVNIPESEFKYEPNSRTGQGRAVRHLYYYQTRPYKMYNHGNSAIAEAGFAGAKGYSLFSIGLQTGPLGNEILNRLKQGDGTFTEVKSLEELTPVFQSISKDVQLAITKLSIDDPMGPGFEIIQSDVQDIKVTNGKIIYQNNKIMWDFDTLSNTTPENKDINFEELTYTVEVNNSLIDAPNSDKLYATNGNMTINYKDEKENEQTAVFPVPKVKPVLYQVEKEVKDKDGKVIKKDKNFDITIKGPESFEKKYTLNPAKNNTSGLKTDLRKIGRYSILEKVNDKDYDVKYFVNGKEQSEFTIDEKQSKDINIKVVNQEKPRKLIIVKDYVKKNALDTPIFQFKVTGPNNYNKEFSLSPNQSLTQELDDLQKGKYTVEELTKGYITSIQVNGGEYLNQRTVEVDLTEGNQEAKVTIINRQQSEFPKTGGRGTLIFNLIGWSLMLISGFVWFNKRASSKEV
ncbi:VWA domain-containing protein [Atopobacter phocae]|uniref:VWA domain-containing protein n=1 Tax=Atopobacter phocae TaxID=136492 RepID=UPI000470F89F|nr:VWA domain-containing protein [Atopobacter phocae]